MVSEATLVLCLLQLHTKTVTTLTSWTHYRLDTVPRDFSLLRIDRGPLLKQRCRLIEVTERLPSASLSLQRVFAADNTSIITSI